MEPVTNGIVKEYFKREIRENLRGMGNMLTPIDMDFLTPYHYSIEIEKSLEDGSLPSETSDGELMVRKEDFIDWYAERQARGKGLEFLHQQTLWKGLQA